jgi:hypothetical protein
VIQSFLNDIVLKKGNALADSKALNISGHCFNGKELIFSLLILNLIVRNSPERYSEMLVQVSVLVVNDVETVRFLGSVHVAKLFVEVGIGL